MLVAQAERILGVGKVAGERSGDRVKAAEPSAIGSDPEEPVGVLMDRAHTIASEAVGIFRIVAEMSEVLGILVEASQAAVVGSDPKSAVWVFEDRPDRVMGKRCRVGGVVLEIR